MKWIVVALLVCGCTHRTTPRPLVARVVYPVQEVVDTLHLPSNRRPVCRFRVLSDTTLALMPVNDVRDKKYCIAAFDKWAKLRQPQQGGPLR